MAKKIEVFASEALPGELEDFPDIKRGWGTTKESTGGIPPMKWFNAIQKRTDEAINEIAETSVNRYTFKKGGVVSSNNDLFEYNGDFYSWVGSTPKVVHQDSCPHEEWEGGRWIKLFGLNSNIYKYGYTEALDEVKNEHEVVFHDGFFYKTTSNSFPVTELTDFENKSKWLNLGLLGGYELNDISNFSKTGKVISDHEFRELVFLCNTLGVDITNIRSLPVFLSGHDDLNINYGMDLNGGLLDVSSFTGTVNFVRNDNLCVIHDEESELVNVLKGGGFEGNQLSGLLGTDKFDDSFFIIETNLPFYSYRNELVNRTEYNYHIANGVMECPTRYSMDTSSIKKVTQYKNNGRIIPISNFSVNLGGVDRGILFKISNSNVLLSNVFFSVGDGHFEKSNPTLIRVYRSDHFVGDNVTFTRNTISSVDSGFTYALSIIESFDVKINNFRGDGDGWGATGSNDSVRVLFSKSNLSRVDFHKPVYDYLKIIDCNIGNWGVLCTAIGDVYIERTSFTLSKMPEVNNYGVFRTREDLGGISDGNLTIRDVTINSYISDNISLVRGVGSSINGSVKDSPIVNSLFRKIDIDTISYSGSGSLWIDPVVTGGRLTFPLIMNINNISKNKGNITFNTNLDNVNPYPSGILGGYNFLLSIRNSVFDDLLIKQIKSVYFSSKISVVNCHLNKVSISPKGRICFYDSSLSEIMFDEKESSKNKSDVILTSCDIRSDNKTSMPVGNVFKSHYTVRLIGVSFFSWSEEKLSNLSSCYINGCLFYVKNDSGEIKDINPIVAKLSSGNGVFVNNNTNLEQEYRINTGSDEEGNGEIIYSRLPRVGRTVSIESESGLIKITGTETGISYVGNINSISLISAF